MGAVRKYASWFVGRAPEPIRSLAYFESLINEVRERPFPPGYSAYLRKKVRQFAQAWNDSISAENAAKYGACPDALTEDRSLATLWRGRNRDTRIHQAEERGHNRRHLLHLSSIKRRGLTPAKQAMFSTD